MSSDTARLDPIVQQLCTIQASTRERDIDFAARLGVNRSTWTLVRTGKRRPGPRLLGGARRAFPNLEREIVDFLVAENVTNTTAER